MVVSVPTKGTHLLYRKDVSQKGVQMYVSVPTKGTHLLYIYNGRFGNGYIMFPSPRRGPIFSTRSKLYKKMSTKSFRPHEGDPSSLHLATAAELLRENVSVPTKGTHLLYAEYILIIAKEKYVSVPTKGTHLLYMKTAQKKPMQSVSVPTKGTHLLYVNWLKITYRLFVSVPTKGTHLLYRMILMKCKKLQWVSVPTKGTHLLY